MGYWGKRPFDPNELPDGLKPEGQSYYMRGELTAQRFRAPSGRLYLRINCGGGNIEWRALYGNENWNRGRHWGNERSAKEVR